jgi:hypothetical protein
MLKKFEIKVLKFKIVMSRKLRFKLLIKSEVIHFFTTNSLYPLLLDIFMKVFTYSNEGKLFINAMTL